MELIIQEIATKIIKNTQKNLINVLENNEDISRFIIDTKKTLDEIGTEIVKEALETVNSIIKQEKWRKETWAVVRNDEKTLATVFGQVKYKRTYYKNKLTKEYKYLSDERLGIKTHDKLDASLKAKLVDEAIDCSYRKSASLAVDSIDLSNQTVMNTIRELKEIPHTIDCKTNEKKIIKTLFVEADEDHVALQSGKSIQPKLVYVHEGKKKISKDRYKLKNVKYFSGVYANSEQLWLEVADYIDSVYDTERIENIYLSGDGASWIKEGLSWIKGSVYVLDRFHLSKYVKVATAHMPHTTSMIWHYINQLDKKSVKDLFKVIIDETETETKISAIKDARKYILNNWEGIENQYNEDYIGCSAEGHVSHILADRLSSRPLAWSKIGVDQMAKLRVYKANGGDVYNLVLNNRKKQQKNLNFEKVSKRSINKHIKKTFSYEKIDNITILNKGKKTWMSNILKAFRGA